MQCYNIFLLALYWGSKLRFRLESRMSILNKTCNVYKVNSFQIVCLIIQKKNEQTPKTQYCISSGASQVLSVGLSVVTQEGVISQLSPDKNKVRSCFRQWLDCVSIRKLNLIVFKRGRCLYEFFFKSCKTLWYSQLSFPGWSPTRQPQES